MFDMQKREMEAGMMAPQERRHAHTTRADALVYGMRDNGLLVVVPTFQVPSATSVMDMLLERVELVWLATCWNC